MGFQIKLMNCVPSQKTSFQILFSFKSLNFLQLAPITSQVILFIGMIDLLTTIDTLPVGQPSSSRTPYPIISWILITSLTLRELLYLLISPRGIPFLSPLSTSDRIFLFPDLILIQYWTSFLTVSSQETLTLGTLFGIVLVLMPLVTVF